jgi:hypothetical protein
VVWASDWPHPTEKEKPNEAVLFDLLAEWAPEAAACTAILVENPATLSRLSEIHVTGVGAGHPRGGSREQWEAAAARAWNLSLTRSHNLIDASSMSAGSSAASLSQRVAYRTWQNRREWPNAVLEARRAGRL